MKKNDHFFLKDILNELTCLRIYAIFEENAANYNILTSCIMDMFEYLAVNDRHTFNNLINFNKSFFYEEKYNSIFKHIKLVYENRDILFDFNNSVKKSDRNEDSAFSSTQKELAVFNKYIDYTNKEDEYYNEEEENAEYDVEDMGDFYDKVLSRKRKRSSADLNDNKENKIILDEIEGFNLMKKINEIDKKENETSNVNVGLTDIICDEEKKGKKNLCKKKKKKDEDDEGIDRDLYL